MASNKLKYNIIFDAKTGKIVAATDAVEKLTFSLKGLVATGASLYGLHQAFDFLKDALDISGKFERFSAILETIEGSSVKAEKSMQWLKDFASKTPYEIESLTEAFVKMKSYGLDPMGDGLKTLGDTAAAMGKPLMQAVEALADAVTGENERLKEFGIKASKVADKFKYVWTDASGKTKEIVVKNNKKIIESTLKAIFNSKFAGAMDKMSNTWEGLISNLKDNWVNFRESLMVKSGLFDGLKKGISSVNSYFSSLLKNKDIMKKLSDSIKMLAKLSVKFFEAIAKGATYLGQSFIGIKYIWDKTMNSLSLGWTWLKKKFYELIDTLTSWLPKQPSWAEDIKRSLKELNTEYSATALEGAKLDLSLASNVDNFGTLREMIDNVSTKMVEGIDKTKTTTTENKNLKNSTKEAAEAYLEAHGAIDQTSSSLSDMKDKAKEATKEWEKHLSKVYEAQDKNLDKYSTFLEDMGRKEEAWQIKKKKLIEEYRDTLTDDELKAYLDLKKKEYLDGDVKYADKVKSLWSNVYDDLKTSLEDTFSKITLDGSSLKSAFSSLLDDIKKSILSPFVKTVSEGLSSSITEALGLSAKGLSGKGLIGSIKDLFSGNLAKSGKGLLSGISNLFTGLKGSISGGIDSLLGSFTGGAVNNALGNLFGGTLGGVLGSVGSIVTSFVPAIGAVGAIIKGLKGTKRLDQVGIEVRDGLINVGKGVSALANTLVKYEIYKKSGWTGTKTSIRDYMMPKEWESAINTLLREYDKAAKALGKLGKIDLHIKEGYYKFDDFVNQIGLAFIEAVSSAKIDKNKIKAAWQDYAARIGKSINEAIIGKLSELSGLKSSIDKAFRDITESMDNSSYLEKLQRQAKEAKKAFWELSKVVDGGKGVNLRNFADKLNRAVSSSLTPKTIDAWERLGSALLDATKKSKNFVDGLKGLIRAYGDEISSLQQSINKIKGIETVKATTQAIEDLFQKFKKASADTKLEVARNLEDMINTWREERIKAIKDMGLTEESKQKAIDLINQKAIAWLENVKGGLETTQKSLKDLLIEETKKLGQMTGAITALTALEQVKAGISNKTLEEAIKGLAQTAGLQLKTEQQQLQEQKAQKNEEIKSNNALQNVKSSITTQKSLLAGIDNNTANTKTSILTLKAATDQITITTREQTGWQTGVLGSKLDNLNSWSNAIATTIREQANYITGTLGSKLDNLIGTTSRDYTGYLNNIANQTSSWGNAIATTIREQANYIVSTLSNATYSVRDAINAKQISGGGTIDPRPNIDSAKSTLYGIMYSIYSMAAGIKSDLGYSNRLLQQIAGNTA